MSYRAGIFETREAARQTQRNVKRDAFLRSQGFEIVKSPLDLDPDPKAQLTAVQSCLNKAKAGDPDSADFLKSVADQLGGLDLGSGGFVTSKIGRPTPKSASWKTMRSFFGGPFKTW